MCFLIGCIKDNITSIVFLLPNCIISTKPWENNTLKNNCALLKNVKTWKTNTGRGTVQDRRRLKNMTIQKLITDGILHLFIFSYKRHQWDNWWNMNIWISIVLYHLFCCNFNNYTVVMEENVLVSRKHTLKCLGTRNLMSVAYFQMVHKNLGSLLRVQLLRKKW